MDFTITSQLQILNQSVGQENSDVLLAALGTLLDHVYAEMDPQRMGKY